MNGFCRLLAELFHYSLAEQLNHQSTNQSDFCGRATDAGGGLDQAPAGRQPPQSHGAARPPDGDLVRGGVIRRPLPLHRGRPGLLRQPVGDQWRRAAGPRWCAFGNLTPLGWGILRSPSYCHSEISEELCTLLNVVLVVLLLCKKKH